MSAAKNLKPWQPGQSGNPGGKRKRTFPYVDELLKAAGVEPIAEILKLIPKLKDRDQAQIWLEILPYVHTKPIYQDDPSEIEKLSDKELVKLVKEAAKDL